MAASALITAARSAGQCPLGELVRLGRDDVLQRAPALGEHQPDQPPVARMGLAAQQAGRLHPGGGPGHGGGGQSEPPGDLAGRLPVLGPQLAQDELLSLVHAVPREGRRGRRRQGVLGRPERRLEVGRRLIVCMCWLVSTHFFGHASSSVRPRSTLAGSW